MPFNIRVDVYHHDEEPPYVQTIAALAQTLKARNDQLAAAVLELSGQEEPRVWTSSTRSDTVSTPSMEQVIEQLRVEVERNSSVDDSAIQLITTLVDQIEQNQNNPAELQALVTTLREKTDALAASVGANTPADEGEVPQR
jgi:hypothetical protein